MLVLAPALLLASLVSASAHGPSHGHHQHAALAARRAGLLAHERALGELVLPPSGAAPRKRADKRCKVRDSSLTTPSSSQAQAAATSASSSQAPEAPKTTSAAPEPSSTKAEEPAPTTSSTPAPVLVVAPTSTKKEEPKETSTPSNNNNNGGDVSHSSNGLLNINDITCGWSGATSETTNDSGPNGKESWLTCGLQGGGWTPPFISLGELKYADLGEVIGQGNSPFQPCAPYIDQFYQVAQQYGIPPILIASIAMQESTCNPSVTGGGGEQGMFQISQDKCGGAPGGNCKDVSYNMNTAMKYLSDTINQFGGSVLKAVGQYNGWTEGLTVDRATAARYSGCCRCQNNLDYPHQLLNGWMQGRNGNDIGTHFNLRVC